MKTTSVFFASLFLLHSVSGADVRSFPDQRIGTGEANFPVTALQVKKGGLTRATRLSGTIQNATDRDWEGIRVRVTPTDARATRFGLAFPIYVGSLKRGEKKQLFFDLTGKFDFDSLDYKIGLEDAYYPAKYRFRLTAPAPSDALSYSDKDTRWLFVLSKSGLAFSLENLADKTMSLDWDQSSFVDTEGKASGIVSDQTRFIEVNAPKTPTVIPAGARIQTGAIPKSHVSLSSTSKWEVLPILPECPNCKALVGREFQLLIRLTVGGEPKSYTFKFGVDVE